MKSDVLNGLAPNRILSVGCASNIIELIDGTQIHLVCIQKEQDTERLRGLRFDLFLEHSTFPRIIGLVDRIRAYTLR